MPPPPAPPRPPGPGPSVATGPNAVHPGPAVGTVVIKAPLTAAAHPGRTTGQRM
jgi:hypothetical protein